MVVFPMTLTSSVFLSTQTMPGWLQAFAEHQPITIVAKARPDPRLAWIAGLLAVFAPLAVRAYRRNTS